MLSTSTIAITGLGMVSPIGADVVASCASARAGFTCWTELDIVLSDVKTLESIPLKGNAIGWLTQGFEGTGRLLRLGNAALSDLLDTAGLEAPALQRTGLLVQLPGDFHAQLHFQGQMLVSLPNGRLRENVRREFQEEQSAARERLNHRFIPKLAALCGLDIPPRNGACFFGGPATFIHLLTRAIQLLKSRALDRCIIGGIDSWVADDALKQAYELGLLRTPERPVGFFPGEAAAFVLLERVDAARARGAPLQALLGPVSARKEETHRFSGRPSLGRALFEAISDCLSSRTRPSPDTPLTIVNLNGDEFRARDFGSALVRLTDASLPIANRYWHPPEHFGEIGAATGAASICLGVRAFMRKYARSPSILVALLDDDESRGALILEDGHSP